MIRWILLNCLWIAGCAGSYGGESYPLHSSNEPSPGDVDEAMRAWETAPPPQAARQLSAQAPWNAPVRIRTPEDPRRRRAGRRVDIELHQASLPVALQLLANEAKINLVLGDGITGEVSLSLRRVDPLEVLEALVASRDLVLHREGVITIVRKH